MTRSGILIVILWTTCSCPLMERSAAVPVAGDVTLIGQSNAKDVNYSPQQTVADCECGLSSKFNTRIVGGERSSILQYPWMAGVSAFNFIFCGGALINDRYILTVAHCFKEDYLKAHASVFLGVTYRDEQQVQYKVEKVIQHELYNKTIKGRYDIALVKLAEPMIFTEKIRPICLPLPTIDVTDLYGIVTGWGVLSHGGGVSEELRGVPMRIMDNGNCHKIFDRVDDNNICAGGEEGRDACQGDSGSPLIVEVDDVHRLMGVVSWGVGCARKDYPGVFTSVQHYLPWIIEHTRDAECQQEAMNPGWIDVVKAKNIDSASNGFSMDNDSPLKAQPNVTTVGSNASTTSDGSKKVHSRKATNEPIINVVEERSLQVNSENSTRLN